MLHRTVKFKLLEMTGSYTNGHPTARLLVIGVICPRALIDRNDPFTYQKSHIDIVFPDFVYTY
jgi:hypothetical protein